MIEPSGQLLESCLVAGPRPAAAEIAADDSHFFAQRSQRPDEVLAGEAAVLPIRNRLAVDEAIQVDGDVDLVVVIVVEPIGEECFPVSRPQRIEVSGIADTLLPPRKDEEPMRFGRVPIAKQPPGEIALEVAATPDGDAFDARIFERAIDPRAAGPSGWADVPIGMIIEGEKRERLLKLPRPDGAQVMEIAGTEESEGTKIGGVLLDESIDARARGDEAKALGFLDNVDHRQDRAALGRDEIPRVVGAEKDLVGGHDGSASRLIAKFHGQSRCENLNQREIKYREDQGTCPSATWERGGSGGYR